MTASMIAPLATHAASLGNTVPRTLLDGIPISRMGFRESLARLESWFESTSFRRVATANMDFLRQAEKHAELRRALQTASLVTADGMPLVWLSHLVDQPIAERVAGSDLVLPLLERAERNGIGVFLLGSSPQVLAKIRGLIDARFPRLRLAGTFGGKVDIDDASAMAALTEDIRATRTGLLLVALGCPKQELFLSRYGAETGASVGIGIGASLDFLAGCQRRAPEILQRTGLEWAYRLFREPRRLAARYVQSAAYLGRLAGRMALASLLDAVTRQRGRLRAPKATGQRA